MREKEEVKVQEKEEEERWVRKGGTNREIEETREIEERK